MAALAEHGKSTQFGQPNGNPQSQHTNSNKPWGVRKHLKDISNRQLPEEINILTVTEDEAVLAMLPTKRPTLAQMGAARKLVQFARTGADAQYVTDNIDGKQPQTNVNADFAAIQGMSDEELDEFINRSVTSTHRGGDSGEEES